jgi:hypothetical protein
MPPHEASRDASVCLIVCYLGPLPKWLPAYLLTCRHNPTIQFLLFTDQTDLPAAPPNVQFISMNSTQFELRASQALEFSVRLPTAYKLCDYKPAYGRIFKDYLRGFDYWGHADIDVLYGDIRKSLTECRFWEADLFTARQEHLVGHFTLYRNCDHVNGLYTQSTSVPELFHDPQTLSFDECGRQWDRLRRGLAPDEDATCDSMMHVVSRLVPRGELTVRYAPLVAEWPDYGKERWKIRWEDGRLWDIATKQEFMYFHFHFYKHLPGYREAALPFDATLLEATCFGIMSAVNPRRA